MGAGRHDQTRPANPVGLEFLDDNLVEERLQLVGHTLNRKGKAACSSTDLSKEGLGAR